MTIMAGPIPHKVRITGLVPVILIFVLIIKVAPGTIVKSLKEADRKTKKRAHRSPDPAPLSVSRYCTEDLAYAVMKNQIGLPFKPGF